jgi:hypothetical protein
LTDASVRKFVSVRVLNWLMHPRSSEASFLTTLSQLNIDIDKFLAISLSELPDFYRYRYPIECDVINPVGSWRAQID